MMFNLTLLPKNNGLKTQQCTRAETHEKNNRHQRK